MLTSTSQVQPYKERLHSSSPFFISILYLHSSAAACFSHAAVEFSVAVGCQGPQFLILQPSSPSITILPRPHPLCALSQIFTPTHCNANLPLPCHPISFLRCAILAFHASCTLSMSTNKPYQLTPSRSCIERHGRLGGPGPFHQSEARSDNWLRSAENSIFMQSTKFEWTEEETTCGIKNSSEMWRGG